MKQYPNNLKQEVEKSIKPHFEKDKPLFTTKLKLNKLYYKLRSIFIKETSIKKLFETIYKSFK